MSPVRSLIVFWQVYFLCSVSNGLFITSPVYLSLIINQSPLPEPLHAVGCNDRYAPIPGFGSYKVHTHSAHWKASRWICQEEGGDLAVINSDAEAKYIAQLARTCRPQIDSNFPEQFHIGIHTLHDDNKWVTIFGESLAAAGFSGWHVGEPNRGDDPACGAIHYENGELYDSSCSTHLGFICERPLMSIHPETTIPHMERETSIRLKPINQISTEKK